MKILITEVDGFIGVNLLEYLLKNTDFEIVGVSNLPVQTVEQIINNKGERYTHINVNLKYKSCLYSIPKDITHIVHTPYVLNVNNSNDSDRVIVMQNLLEFAEENNINNIIYSSFINNIVDFKNNIGILDSDEISISKIVDNYSKNTSKKIIVLRLSNLYGPNISQEYVHNNIIHEIINASITTIETKMKYSKNDEYNMTYIGDIVNTISFLLGNNEIETGIYDCFNKDKINVSNVVEIINEISEHKVSLDYVNYRTNFTIQNKEINIIKKNHDFRESLIDTYEFYNNRRLKNLVIYVNSLHGVGGAEKYLHTILPILSKTFNIIVITYENSFHEIFDDHEIYSMANVSEIMELSKQYNNKDTIFLSILHNRLDKVYKFFNRCRLVMQWHSIIGDHTSKNGGSYISSHLNNIISYDPQLITVLGKASKEKLKEKYGMESEIFYNVFEDTKNLSLLKNEIIWVGSYRHEKGINKLIEIINNYNGKLKFKIYGNWSEEDIVSFKKKIKEADEKVIIAGFEQDIEKMYGNASIILSTSKVEGWGRVITEANLRGIPAIMAYRSENSNEIIVDGINGYIVDSGNVDLVKKYIDKLVRNSEKYSITSRKYAKRFLVEKNQNTMISNLVKVPEKNRKKFKSILIYTDQLYTYGGIEDILKDSIPELFNRGYKIYVVAGGDSNQPYLRKGNWYKELEPFIEKTFVTYRAKDKIDFFDWIQKNNNNSTFVYVPKYWGFSEFNKLLLNTFIHVEWLGGLEGEYSDHVLKILRTINFDTISFLGYDITNKVLSKFPAYQDVVYLPVRYSKKYINVSNNKINKIVWVGRYNANKNPYLAIDLAKEILNSKEFENYKFYMYGEFDERNEYYAYNELAKYANSDRIVISSFCEKDEIFSDAKYLLNTSTEEGWALVFEDAISYGTVCIAPTWLSSVKEVFKGINYIPYDNNCLESMIKFEVNYSKNYEEYLQNLENRNTYIDKQENFKSYIENGYYRNWSKR